MIYDAEKYKATQDLLHRIFDGEKIARAYRKINRYRTAHKLPTFEILMPEPKKEKEFSEHGGDCCMECGGTHLRKTGTCAVCETCGSSQGCS